MSADPSSSNVADVDRAESARRSEATSPISRTRGTNRIQRFSMSNIEGPWATFTSADWGLGLTGLLLYLLAVITFRFPIAPYAVGLMALGVLTHEHELVSTPFSTGLFCILAWSLLGVGLSEWRQASFAAWLELVKVAIICFLMPQVLRNKRTVLTALLAHVAMFTLYPVRGSIFNRLAGETEQGRWMWNYIYNNPNDYASLTVLALGSVVALLCCFWHRPLVRTGLIGLLFTFLFVVVMTQSRGVGIGLTVGIALFGVYASARVRKTLLVSGVVVALATPILVPRDVLNRYFASAVNDDTDASSKNDLRVNAARGSTEERTELLMIGLHIARDHLLFGVGLGAYPFANAQYAPEKGARDTHNTYVNLAAEAGIPALLLFLGLCYLTFRPCHRAIIALRARQPLH